MAFDGPNSLTLPGTTTDYVQGPAGLATQTAVNGFDLRIRLTYDATTNPVPWLLGAALGTFQTRAIGITATARNSSAAGFTFGPTAAQAGNPAAGDWLTLRYTYSTATGQGTSFTSPDGGTTWTQATQNTRGAPYDLISDPSWVLRTFNPYSGQFAWIDLRTFDGTPLASCDLTRMWPPSNTWTDPQGNTWSLQGSGWSWQGPAPPPLAVTTTSLPAATRGVPYSTQLQAAGGFPPYTWAVTDGALPAGLSLAADGTISGTPT